MLNNTNKNQLKRLSEYIDVPFGVISDIGNVEFLSEQGISDDIVGLFLSAQEDTPDAQFFTADKFAFYELFTNSDETYYIFINTYDIGTHEQAKRILKIAAFAFLCGEQQSSKNFMQLFRKLMIDGRHSVSTHQVREAYAEHTKEGMFFAVLLVTRVNADKNHNVDENDISTAIQSVFFADRGFIVVNIDNNQTAIICTLDNDNTYDDIIQYADTIHDTMLSEAMTDVYVSAGSPVGDIMDISVSYEEAVKATSIGKIFELRSKCFVYSRLGLEKMIFSIPKDAARAYINELFGESFLRDKSSRELLSTVHAFLMNNLNVSEASRALYIHRNTLMYRLEKFNKMTNLDCTKFATAMQIDVAMRMLQYLEK